MARGRSVIVGGGLATSGALAVGALLYVVNVDPPTAAISPMMAQVTGANQGVIVSSNRADPQAAAVEVLRVKGGAIIEGSATDSVHIGRGVTVAAGAAFVAIGNGTSVRGTAIAIGTGASAHGTSNDITIGATTFGAGARNFAAVTVGNFSAPAGGTGGGWVFIGSGAASNIATSATDIVGIGTSLTFGNTTGNFVAIGANISTGTSGSFVLIGSDSTSSGNPSSFVAVGPSNIPSHANTIIIGIGQTTTAVSQCWIADSGGNGITSIIVGKGDISGTPLGLTFRLTNANASADINGGDFTLVAGRGTGAGVPGGVAFAVGIQTGTSSTLQVQRTGAEVRFSSTATHTYLLIYDVDNAALERVTVGAADSAGAGFKVLRIPN